MGADSYEDEQQRYAVTDRRTDNESLVVTLAETVTEVDQRDSSNFQLYDHVDTDALTALVENTPPTSELEVRFRIGGQRVVVTGDGMVHLE